MIFTIAFREISSVSSCRQVICAKENFIGISEYQKQIKCSENKNKALDSKKKIKLKHGVFSETDTELLVEQNVSEAFKSFKQQ